MESDETVADIVDDIREYAAAAGLVGMNMLSNRLSEFATRIEAAHKREVREVVVSKIETTTKESLGVESTCKEPLSVESVTTCNGLQDSCKQVLQGNNAKMREALSDACYAMFNFLKTQNGGFEEMAKALDKAKAALAAPLRNCDIGTVEEQADRFFDFCDGYHCATGYNGCGTCPLWTSGTIGKHCELKWAQMPCEKGDVE